MGKGTMELYELIYQSQATQTMTDTELKILLAKSRLNNLVHGITGCLIYHNREFIQVFEGAKVKVLQLFENIKKDPSNRNVEVIWKGSIYERGFSGWSMAYINPTERDNLEAFSDYLNSGRISNDIPEVITISKNLLANLKESLIH